MNQEKKAGLLPHGRHRSVALIVTLKVVIVALVLVLPSGLAISLGAAHGVALALVAVAAGVLLVVRHVRNRGDK
jgi:amino acid permease